jgi:hypothetical protein
MTGPFQNQACNRREFLQRSAVTGILLTLGRRSPAAATTEPSLTPSEVLGQLRREEGPAPLALAIRYVAEKTGDGLLYRLKPGALTAADTLTFDMLLDGQHMTTFHLTLQEGDEGPAFSFRWGCLNQCSLRVRFPLSMTDLNRWGIDREGAFLKPRCYGQRVDLEKVDRLILKVNRKSDLPARFCMTGLRISSAAVPRLVQPVLPNGPLLDEMGQSTIHHWPGKTASVAALKQRLQGQLQNAPQQQWPDAFSTWGGWKDKRLTEGSGFYRTHHDGKRWWLVDPEGFAFWSTGLDCVRVDTTANYTQLETALTWLPQGDGTFAETLSERNGLKQINYLAANFIRAFGPDHWRDKWARIALAELRRLGFNTVGNWSEWDDARAARFPYVRPLSFKGQRVTTLYRDFPDVYHPDMERDAEDYARQLRDTAEDPALIGYFLMNEPQWGFSSELPAVGMLYNTESCHTRAALHTFLQQKYGSSAALSAAWGISVNLEAVKSGRWRQRLPEAALPDLEAFSSRMSERYFKILSAACKRVDENHLNLGMRWAGLPPTWAAQGMKSFDVFSINCYREKVPRDQTEQIHKLLGMPVIVGEWHFGALDVGLPSSGIGHLRNQTERAKAYRVYLEDAAANPCCVGAHWFTLYDESALGRFDGENYNIGFLDVCNRAYDAMGAAARASHGRLYDIASARVSPYQAALEYLPKLY